MEGNYAAEDLDESGSKVGDSAKVGVVLKERKICAFAEDEVSDWYCFDDWDCQKKEGEVAFC